MIVYTAEDFAGASFARHPVTGATACRIAGAKCGPAWTTEDLAETTDEDMARDGWVPVVESRVTLDALEAAWDAAEEASECRKGDVLIMQDPAEGYSVWRTGDADYLSRSTRVLSRAPREPWADLADVLRARLDDGVVRVEVDWAARELHAAGWRKTGGDEK